LAKLHRLIKAGRSNDLELIPLLPLPDRALHMNPCVVAQGV
jgi:hypothetical protein